MSTSTIGPVGEAQWSISSDVRYYGLLYVNGPSFKVSFWTNSRDITEQQVQQRLRDGYLIAAAPDLLKALNAVLDSSGARGTYHSLEYRDAIAAAEAAIARATSPTPGSTSAEANPATDREDCPSAPIGGGRKE